MESISSFKTLMKSYKASTWKATIKISTIIKIQILHNTKFIILILGRSEEGSNERALHLLALLKEARQLTKQKIASQTIEVAFYSRT